MQIARAPGQLDAPRRRLNGHTAPVVAADRAALGDAAGAWQGKERRTRQTRSRCASAPPLGRADIRYAAPRAPASERPGTMVCANPLTWCARNELLSSWGVLLDCRPEVPGDTKRSPAGSTDGGITDVPVGPGDRTRSPTRGTAGKAAVSELTASPQFIHRPSVHKGPFAQEGAARGA